MIDVLYTAHEAASLLRVQPQQIWRWARSGKLRVFYLGPKTPRSRLRIQESDLLAFIGVEPEDRLPRMPALPIETVIHSARRLKDARESVRAALSGFRRLPRRTK